MFLAFAGIFVAGYLSMSDWLGYEIPCGASSGCNTVEASPYSHWLGIPVAAFGLVAYIALAGLSMTRTFGAMESKRRATTAGLIISGLGTLISFFLIFESVSIIGATCLWCMASAAIMMLSFLSHGFMSQHEVDQTPATQVDQRPSTKSESGPVATAYPAAAGGLGSTKKDRTYIAVLVALTLVGLSARFLDVKGLKEGPGITHAENLTKTIDGMIPTDTPHVLGPFTAPVIIVEFGDLTCPHCKKSYQELTNVVRMSDNKVRFVFRHFPLITNQSHKMSAMGAAISEIAAEKGKFWNFLDKIYAVDEARQAQLTASDLFGMASEIGLNSDELKRRLQDSKDPAYGRLTRDLNLGGDLGVSVTPTFVYGISGQKPLTCNSSTLPDRMSAPPYSQYVRGLR